MWLLKLLPGVSQIFSTIDSVTKTIGNLEMAKVAAKTDEEKARIQAQIDILKSQADLFKTEAQGRWGWMPILVQTLMAVDVLILVTKVLVWDKAFGQWTAGHTDALDANLWTLILMAWGFYFVQGIMKRVGL